MTKIYVLTKHNRSASGFQSGFKPRLSRFDTGFKSSGFDSRPKSSGFESRSKSTGYDPRSKYSGFDPRF